MDRDWFLKSGIIVWIVFSLLSIILGTGIWLIIGVIGVDLLAGIIIIWKFRAPSYKKEWTYWWSKYRRKRANRELKKRERKRVDNVEAGKNPYDLWEIVLITVPTSAFLLMFSLGSIVYDDFLFGLQFYIYGWILFIPALSYCIPFLGIVLIFQPSVSVDFLKWSTDLVNLPIQTLTSTFFWIFVIAGLLIGCIITAYIVKFVSRKLKDLLEKKSGKGYVRRMDQKISNFLASPNWDHLDVLLKDKNHILHESGIYYPEIRDNISDNYRKIEILREQRNEIIADVEECKILLKNRRPGQAFSILMPMENSILKIQDSKLLTKWSESRNVAQDCSRNNWHIIEERLKETELFIQVFKFNEARNLIINTKILYDDLFGFDNAKLLPNAYKIDFDSWSTRIYTAEKIHNVQTVVLNFAKDKNRAYINDIAESAGYPAVEVIPILQQLIADHRVPARYDAESKIVDLDLLMEQMDALNSGFADWGKKSDTVKKD